MRLLGHSRALGPALILFLALPATADVIVLKNGRRIHAANIREQGARISYETEEGDSYALPRSLVERIEKQEEPATTSSASRRGATHVPLPPLTAEEVAAKAPVLPNGEVDRDYLESLAARPIPDQQTGRNLAALFSAAARYEMQRGRVDSAVSLVQRGLSALPNDPLLALNYGVLLLHRQQYQLARDWLGRASVAAPDWPSPWKFLGYAEYFSDRTDDAMRAWQKALALKPDPEVKEMLERAQRETAAEANHVQASSSHFTLRFEGRQVPDSLRRGILEALERHYATLEREMGVSPREPIPVILYTDQAFRDVTRVPSWAGAVNDGRVRVPVDGLSSVTSELSGVLKHEVVHSFVWAKTRGQCPAWLNEGLAQLLEGAGVKGDRRLAELWKSGKYLPLAALQESFVRLGPGMASLSYAESLAAVEFLVSRWGMFELVRLLSRLGEGSPPEAALQSVYRMSYADLEQALGDWLKN